CRTHAQDHRWQSGGGGATARHLAANARQEDGPARRIDGGRAGAMTAPSPLEPSALAPAVAALIEEAQRSERAGQREIARRKYETALYLLRPGDGATATAIVRRIARAYIDDGQSEAGLDCLSAALGMSEGMGELSGQAHALNLMAISHVLRGGLEEAERLYDMALHRATAAGDEPLIAMIAQNLGIFASRRGDFVAALDHYASSLVTYRTAGLS